MSTFYDQIQQIMIEDENKKKEPIFNEVKQLIETAAKSGKRYCYVYGNDEYYSLLTNIQELENFNIEKRERARMLESDDKFSIVIHWKNKKVSYDELKRKNEDLKFQLQIQNDLTNDGLLKYMKENMKLKHELDKINNQLAR